MVDQFASFRDADPAEVGWLPIKYDAYWDFPRHFAVSHKSTIYVVSCDFSDDEDGYPDVFDVFSAPTAGTGDDELAYALALPRGALVFVRQCPVQQITFDKQTHRRYVREEPFCAFGQANA